MNRSARTVAGRHSRDRTGLAGAGRLVAIEGGDPTPPPIWHHAPVLAAQQMTDRYRSLRLHAPTIASRARPGQFVLLNAGRPTDPDTLAPRPMTVFRADPDDGTIEVVFAVLGRGTRALAEFGPDDRLPTLGPLGQGFRLHAHTTSLLLVGRGIGTCSLTSVARQAVGSGAEVCALVSGRHPGALIGSAEFRSAGVARVFEVTDDAGTSDVDAVRRTLVEALEHRPPQQILACGSDRLARLCLDLAQRWSGEVQVSLEAHMACGAGDCDECASGRHTADREPPLVCVRGPVFRFVPGHPDGRGTETADG